VRHLIAVSTELLDMTFGANWDAESTDLFGGSAEFGIQWLAIRFGIPFLPEMAGWFEAELLRRGLESGLH